MLRRLLQALLLIATLVVGAAAVAIVVSQTAWFRDWLRGFIVQQANQYLNGTLSIGSLGGNLFFGLELQDVGLVAGGERVVSVRNAGIDYSAIQLVSGNLVIDHIRLDQPEVVLARTAEGWNLARLVKRQEREQERTGPARAVTIGEIGISDGRLTVQERGAVGTSGAGADVVPRVIDRLNASISFKYEPVHYTARIAHVSFRSANPDIALNDLSGTVSQREDDLYVDHLAIRTAESVLALDGRIVNYLAEPVVQLTASSDKLSLPEIARVVPAMQGIDLQPSFRVAANGPLDRVRLDFQVKSSAGNATGQVTAALMGPKRRLAGVLTMEALDLAPIVRTPAAKSRLTGSARIDLALPPMSAGGPAVGTFDARFQRAEVAGYVVANAHAKGRVDGLRVTLTDATGRAYGADARVAGVIVPGSEARGTQLALDLRGRATGLDLRRLPRQLEVPPAPSRLDFDYRLAGNLAALRGSADFRRSEVAGAVLLPGTTASFTKDGQVIGYSASGQVSGLDLQKMGQAFEVQALAADRFASDINGRFSMQARGTKLPEIVLDATASLENSTLAMAKVPALQGEAHLNRGALRVRASGDFAGVDPGALSGRKDLAGEVSGRLMNVEANVADIAAPVTPESVNASGRVELAASTIGPISLDRAAVAGSFSNSTARVDEATVEGRDLNLKASGTLALGTSGASDLQYHLDVRDLSEVGKMLGQQLQGSLVLDGKTAGNRANLQASGNVKGTNLGYGANRALSAESQYQVEVPNFDASAARLTADSRLMFLVVGGQEVTRLQAKTTYGGKQLEFDAEAQQAQRQGRAAGRLILHPDHQEVHLASFGLTTQGVQWALAPGTEPAVEYGGDEIRIQRLELVSGPQRLEVNGTVGKSDSRLRAGLRNIDLARLDTWLIGDRRLGGVLNASARITGPRDRLRVDGDFAVDNGSFRDFRYQSFAGTAAFAGRQISMDVRLQQSPQTWLVARGTIPTALFEAAAPGRPAPAGASDPVDFTVQSSSIDLGLVQGFTTAVEKVTGRLQADVRVTGTAEAPSVDGFVEIAQGALSVPATGVSYSQLDGRVALRGDRAVVERLSVLDEHKKSLTMSGEVAARGKAIGELKAVLKGDDFELVHNDLGHVVVDTNLQVGGQLKALRVDGDISMEKAEVALDKVLELEKASLYSTAPTSPPAAETTDTAAAGSPARATSPTAPTAPASARPVPVSGQGGQGQQPGGQGGTPAAPAGPFDAAQLNVRVRIPGTLIIQGKDIRPPGGGSPVGLGDVNITLGGDLRIQKAAGAAPELIGDIRTVRGTYDFQGRRFDLERDGRVRFEGIIPIDPALDLTATRVISGVEARVHVGGTMRKPELSLTSQPPMDESDILSLIVFNQPANQLGAGEQVSLSQRASALATSFVASKLADSLGRALDLDIFEIEAAPAGAGQGATVTVGEQVGQRLFVRLRQGVGADTATSFIMEYQLLDFLRLETTVSQGGNTTRSMLRRMEGTGLDMIFFFSY